PDEAVSGRPAVRRAGTVPGKCVTAAGQIPAGGRSVVSVPVGRQRRGPRRRRALAGADVGGPAAFVLLRREAFQLRLAAGDGLLVDLLEEGDAPAAAGAGAAALRELARHLGPALADEIEQLPPRHVEAVAHFGVEVHDGPAILPSPLWGASPLAPRASESGPL